MRKVVRPSSNTSSDRRSPPSGSYLVLTAWCASRSQEAATGAAVIRSISMTALRAHAENGHVVLDEPLDVPDGTPLTVNVSSDMDASAAVIDPEIDAAWRAEARRRSEELRSGAVAPIPWEEVDRLLGE